MTHKVYVVTDVGFGDGGKGSVVHKISQMVRAHTVIKRGGAQGSHSVHTSKGEKFAFSQWGCGTLDGIPTHLSGQMVISPEGLLNEANALRYQLGIYDPFSLLTIDEQALCTTPFHGIASRVKELARSENPRGTVGTGVGEAYRDLGRMPEYAIMAKDLKNPNLRELLTNVREYIGAELQPIINGEFLASDRNLVEKEVNLLFDDKFLDYVVERFIEAGEYARIVSCDFLGDEILSKEGAAVVETSHGVLTDRLVGFHPHTSAIRTLPSFTQGMLERAGYAEQVVNIGVARAYAIRHGAGPMPTADPEMTKYMLPNNQQDENRYQGKARAGSLDLVLMRYALEVCGGPGIFDGLAVTCFDQIQTEKIWRICNHYTNATDQAYFSSSGEIRSHVSPSSNHQARLGRRLRNVQPTVKAIAIDETESREGLYDVSTKVLGEMVETPVKMVSFGPTELDKLYK